MLELFGHPVEEETFVPTTEMYMEETLKHLREALLREGESFEWVLSCHTDELETLEQMLQTSALSYERYDARANIQLYDFHLKGLSPKQLSEWLTLEAFGYVKVGGLFAIIAGSVEIEYEIDDLGCCFTEGIPVLYLSEASRAFVVSHDLYGYTVVESLV